MIDYSKYGIRSLWIDGIHLVESNAMVDRVLIKMCRSKRKRIKRKWLKNPRNYRYQPRHELIWMKQQNTMIGHPTALKLLILALENRKSKSLSKTIENYKFYTTDIKPFKWESTLKYTDLNIKPPEPPKPFQLVPTPSLAFPTVDYI